MGQWAKLYDLARDPKPSPRLQRPPLKEVVAHDLPDCKAMTDEELSALYSRTTFEADAIREQLAIDRASPDGGSRDWQRRAEKALGYKNATAKLLVAEVQARRERAARERRKESNEAAAARAEAERALSEQRTLEKQAAIALRHAEIQAARAMKQAAWEKHQARRARMFVAAARALWGKDEIMRVWQRAHEMFPDAEVAGERAAREDGHE